MHLSANSTFNYHPIFVSRRLSPSKSLKRPNKMVFSCHQATLDLNNMLSLDSTDASVEDIKKAYRKMALHYHPDVCDPSRRDECTMVFLKLHDTYKALLDKASSGSNPGVEGKEEECKQWEIQVKELQRRSKTGMRQRDQSWASRMRAQHIDP